MALIPLMVLRVMTRSLAAQASIRWLAVMATIICMVTTPLTRSLEVMGTINSSADEVTMCSLVGQEMI